MISTNSIINLPNLKGIEEIDDFSAELCTGGAFRFAVSPVGSDTARSPFPYNVQGTTNQVRANAFDGRMRLTATDNAGNLFAVAIHDADTGENLVQVRGENNPARSDELIDLAGTFDRNAGRFVGRNLVYRVRQFTAPAGPNPSSNFSRPKTLIDPCSVCDANLVGGLGLGSDRRIKTDIKVVGFLSELGIQLYSWKYRNSDQTRYVGVMAQDLLARPNLSKAVVVAREGEFKGFYAVDYGSLGLKMVTEAEWISQGMSAVNQANINMVCA